MFVANIVRVHGTRRKTLTQSFATSRWERERYQRCVVEEGAVGRGVGVGAGDRPCGVG